MIKACFKNLLYFPFFAVTLFSIGVSADEPKNIGGVTVIGKRGCPENSICDQQGIENLMNQLQQQAMVMDGPGGGGGGGGSLPKKDKNNKEKCKAQLTEQETTALMQGKDFAVLRGSSCGGDVPAPEGWGFATKEETDEYYKNVGNIPGTMRCGGRAISLNDPAKFAGGVADCSP